MESISISARAKRELSIASKLSGQSIAQIVDRLLDLHATAEGEPENQEGMGSVTAGGDPVPIVGKYKGREVSALFDVNSQRVTILDGLPTALPRELGSPSQAAIEVVRLLNPHRLRPETNGWRFWVVRETGALLDSVRKH